MKTSPLKMLRDSLDLKQAQLAKKLKLTPGRISQVEGGNGALGRDSLLLLARIYRVDIARLGLSIEDFMETPRR